MDNIRCQKIRDKDDHDKQGEVKLKREGKEGLLPQQENRFRATALTTETKSVSPQKYSCSVQQARLQLQEPSPSPSIVASPPSASSSPSHEFSFTISVHHPPSATTAAAADRTKTTPPSFAIDLSPADEIFFHGHLLPLHLLSHLPVSPRSSTNSMDSFTLPIKELLDEQNQNKTSNNITTEDNKDLDDQNSHCHQSNDHHEAKGRGKPKSFSLFGLPKWRKGCQVQDKERERQKRKLKFDVSHVLKRYIRMVRPLLSFRSRRESMDFQRQSHSFSGNLSFRGKKEELRGRRGKYSSAPASMWTSPTNSGHLVATGSIHTSTSDSTMEELQAAIQAAIAHCKNSISMEEKKQHHD